MAEGGLEGLFGGESEDGLEADAGLSGAALADSLALDEGKGSDEARDYLKDARRLLGMQMEHLHEQRTLNLRHMQARRWKDGLQLAFQLFTAMVAGALGFGVAVMLHDAFASRSVIVEPFDAPPALAARGLTGKVVAGGLLDELTRLQTATRTSAAKRNLSNAWTSDIKVEVPETGVSIGELDRLLKDRFGHDLHIEGDLLQTDAGGLALTVRGGGVLPKTFEGAAGDLAKLTAQAAQYIYGQSEPSLYAIYLVNAGRSADAVAFSRAAFSTAPKAERPYLLNGWANALENTGGSTRDALALYLAALKLKPNYWIAHNNVINATWAMADEEGAWKAGEAMRAAAGGRPGRAPELYYQNVDTLTWNLAPWRAAIVADTEAHAGVGTEVTANGPSIADIDARMHDPVDAQLALQTAQGDATDPSVEAMTHFVRGRLAAEAGDLARAAAEMEAFAAGYGDPTVSTNYPGYNCWVAPAEEAAGHPDKADAALKAGGRYVDCYRFQGDILDHRGDWTGAQKAYATAVAIAPDLPAGYYSWGVALARHGDPAGALARLQAANLRGPHWADPLKAWGDVLAGQGRWRDAAARYDAALKYAPAWAALRQARALAVRRAG